MNPLMLGKGYLTLIGVLLNLAGVICTALGQPEIGKALQDAGLGLSTGGVIRKGVAGL